MSNRLKYFYEFGEFRFDPEKKVLFQKGVSVLLPPRATDVLAMLLEERGNLVEREQLLNTVWQDAFVEDGNLNNAVSTLRKALGGNGIIQTVPRRGYRFTSEVSKVAEEEIEELVFEKRTITETTVTAANQRAGTEHGSRELTAGRSFRKLYVAVAGLGLIAIAAAGYYFYTSKISSPFAPSQVTSLAVLPLRSFSANAVDNELRFRITDALITKLARDPSIAVRSTNSVLRFDQESRDAVAAGTELGVDGVLDGSVQAENGKLRVTLQLLAIPSGDQIWAEQFDGKTDEILSLQDNIANRLRRDLSVGDQDVPAVAANNESYEAYLKGRYLWNQRRRESYYSALEYFEQSVAIDPNFALGHAGIADVYYLLQQRNELPVVEAYSKAEEAARKALTADPNLAEAHAAMGVISYLRHARWTEAESHFLRAIELNPNFAETYGRLGMLYNALGRFEESEQVLRKGLLLEPTSLNLSVYLGANFYFSKQFERAENQFKRILEFAPGTERAHFFLERLFAIQGRHDEAVEHALKERSVSHPATVEPLRMAYERDGIRGFWVKQIEFLKDELRHQYGTENHIAARYVLLGDAANACRYVELNLTALGSMMNYGRVDPVFDPIRSEPCFRSLMAHTEPAV